MNSHHTHANGFNTFPKNNHFYLMNIVFYCRNPLSWASLGRTQYTVCDG